jgi:hypothetical protein
LWPFGEIAAGEGRSGADQGDQMGCVHGAPASLGGFDELEVINGDPPSQNTDRQAITA